MDLDLIASITPRNGAYLISFDHHPSFVDDGTPVDLYDCARSLATAKRVTKRDARDGGCTHLRWAEGPEHGYNASVLLLLGSTAKRDDVGQVSY